MGISRAHCPWRDGILAIVAQAVGDWSEGAARGMQRTSAGFKLETRMIRSLRQRHRRIVIAMGVVLPVVFTVGVAARKPAPTAPSLPTEPAAVQLRSATTVWDRSDLFAKTAIQARLLRENTSSGRFGLKLSAAGDFAKPDLIVYWVAENSKGVESLPDNALLLGGFHSASLLLPTEAIAQAGVLVLYSLPNSEIVDVSRPLRITESTK